MMRKPRIRWLQMAVAATTWIATVAIVEASAENEIGRTARQLEERIELQLRRMERFDAPVPEPRAPERSHEESIEPWELVGV
jgi:hypothetical protein